MNKNQNFKSTGQRKSWCTIQTGVQHYHRRNATYWCCQLALETTFVDTLIFSDSWHTVVFFLAIIQSCEVGFQLYV